MREFTLGTRGVGTVRAPQLDDYRDFVIHHQNQKLLVMRATESTAPTITYPQVVVVTDMDVDIQFTATAGISPNIEGDSVGFEGSGSTRSPTTVKDTTFTSGDGEGMRAWEVLSNSNGAYELDIRPQERATEAELRTDIFEDPDNTMLRVRGVDDNLDVLLSIRDATYVDTRKSAPVNMSTCLPGRMDPVRRWCSVIGMRSLFTSRWWTSGG